MQQHAVTRGPGMAVFVKNRFRQNFRHKNMVVKGKLQGLRGDPCFPGRSVFQKNPAAEKSGQFVRHPARQFGNAHLFLPVRLQLANNGVNPAPDFRMVPVRVGFRPRLGAGGGLAGLRTLL